MKNKKSKLKREPLQKAQFILYLFKRLFFHVSGDYLTETWSWKWNLRVMCVLSLLTFIGVCHTFSLFENRHNMSEFILSACLIMVAILGLQRMFQFITSHTGFLGISERILEFTEKWEQIPEGYTVLNWYFRLLRQFTVGFSIMIAISVTLLAIVPIIVYFVFGKMVLTWQCYIPLIDYNSHPGFEIHVFFHGLCNYCGGTGLTAVVIFELLIFLQVCIEIDVLRARLKLLTDDIQNQTPEPNQENITKNLKHIFESHQMLLEYIDSCEDFLTIQNLADHVIVGIQTCLGVYICLQQFWFVAFVLIVAEFVIIFLINCFGTIIEVKMEKLSYDIYDLPWYLTSVKNQKMFCYFLGNSIKTERLSLAGRVPLSLNTFVGFYKGIYSYLMILRTMKI